MLGNWSPEPCPTWGTSFGAVKPWRQGTPPCFTAALTPSSLSSEMAMYVVQWITSECQFIHSFIHPFIRPPIFQRFFFASADMLLAEVMAWTCSWVRPSSIRPYIKLNFFETVGGPMWIEFYVRVSLVNTCTSRSFWVVKVCSFFNTVHVCFTHVGQYESENWNHLFFFGGGEVTDSVMVVPLKLS